MQRDYSAELGYICPVHCTGIQGRPKFNIPVETHVRMHNIHGSWSIVAEEVGVSYRTVLRWRHQFSQPVGADLSHSHISQDSLCNTVREILQVVPNTGETYIIGALGARDIHVQRWRVRATIQAVDPISCSLRRTRAILRRIYNVFSPNALW